MPKGFDIEEIKAGDERVDDIDDFDDENAAG